MRKLIDDALEYIDSGFDKLGRTIQSPTLTDRYLLASTYHSVRLTKAIIFLCENEFTNEAIPILRTLIEHSINMRWILNKDTDKRLSEYIYDLKEKGFGAHWTKTNLYNRMQEVEVGFENRDYFDLCVKVTYSFAHANATALDWSEVFEHPELSSSRWKDTSLYPVVVQMLGHTMKALDSHYSGYFNEYETFWKKVPVDPDVRSKIEKIYNDMSVKN